MATTTNYSWSTPDDTSLVKDGAAAIRTLGSSIDTTTKALNPSTTLGDIEYRSSTANTNTRLGIGSTGNVLTVSGGVPVWAAPASSGGMTLLSTTTMSGTSTTVSSISGSYKQLVIQVLDFYPSANAGFRFRLNSDATANAYRYMQQQGDSNSPYATASPQWFFNDSSFQVQATQLNSDSNSFLWIELPNYADTSTNKFARFQSAWTNAGSNKQTTFSHGYWENTAAVSSIEFSNNGTSATAGSIKIWGVN